MSPITYKKNPSQCSYYFVQEVFGVFNMQKRIWECIRTMQARRKTMVNFLKLESNPSRHLELPQPAKYKCKKMQNVNQICNEKLDNTMAMARDHNLPNLKNFEKCSSCARFLPIFVPCLRIMKARILLLFKNISHLCRNSDKDFRWTPLSSEF